MFTSIRKLGFLTILLATLGLAGCGGGSDIESGEVLLACTAPNVPNSAGTACVPPPPIQCAPPTVPDAANENCVVGANPDLPDPVFFPSETQAVLYYNRLAKGATNVPNDPSYEGWRLHTWNNDACDALQPESLAPSWDNGLEHDGVDPNYGAYWVLELKEGYGSCHNFIIHLGTDDAGKEMGGADFKASLVQDDERFARMNFTLTGEPTVFEFPLISLGERPVQIEGIGAHWLDVNTILWDAPDVVESVKLHYSAVADLEATLENGLNGTVVEMMAVSLTEAQQAIAPHLNSLAAFQGEWDAAAAKAVMKTQAVLAGYDVDGKLVAATGIQLANGLDMLYTSGEADADEAQLGLVYNDDDTITTSVWAPTAQNVQLKLYSNDKRLTDTIAMSEDSNTGIWSYTGNGLDRVFYRFEVTVFHPVTGDIEVFDVTDPYSVSLGVNGRFSQFVNLNDADLKPEGWEEHTIPTIANPEDAVIYEGHIRDFSALDASTPEAHRGKFMAFTEAESVPVQHLRDLAQTGITHFHMLPANDIATIDERADRTVDLNSTVFELCLLNRRLDICDEVDTSMTLQEVFDSYDPFLEPDKAQALTEQLRNYDQFNWGYDPKHFNAPEGSYATDPDGVARILEMRAMNQALHEMGLRVVLDVVYNHTNASGANDNSVFDKVVPVYYHRYTVDTGSIVRDSCCDDTEDRNRMMAKFMEDSLLMWTTQYKFDGFRFDLMASHSKDTMLALRDAVQAVDPDNYFYGEGWTRNDRGVTQANQPNLAGSEIGTFNDQLREAVRQGRFFAENNGDNSGDILDAGDRIKSGLAGTLTDYALVRASGTTSPTSSLGGYAMDPADIINYVSKHDGLTLWDQFNYVLPDNLTLAERVRAQNIGISIPLLSQGIPFLQMGGEMLRSKSMDRNTYDAGDWFNRVDFTMMSNNYNVGLPLAMDNRGAWDGIGQFVYSPERAATMDDITFAHAVFKEFLSIRAGSALFRLTSADDIKARVGFHNLGRNPVPGLIAMSIDDGMGLTDLDPMVDAMMVMINATGSEQSLRVNTATGFNLHTTLANSIDPTVRGASFAEGVDDDAGNGLFTVPAHTIAVFVQNQGAEQGAGLSAFATAGAPDVVPYGDTVVYLRGSMNGWGQDTPFSYEGQGIYRTTFTLEEGTEYQFKIAEADWSNPNLGGPDGESDVVGEGVTYALAPSNNNLKFTPDATALYEFIFDAVDTANPTLLVRKDNPYFGTEVYVRGGMNGWGTGNPLTYAGNKMFTANFDVAVGDYEFKVASEDWSTVDHGAVEDTDAARNLAVGSTLDANLSGGPNFRLSIDSEEAYQFTLDVSGEVPVIGVFKAEFFGATPVFLRGGMNGWGTADQLTYADNAYSVSIAISAGIVEFKVASDDWAAVNAGAVDGDNRDVTLGQPLMMLQGSNDNLRFDAPETGSYTFTVTGPNPQSPSITVTRDE